MSYSLSFSEEFFTDESFPYDTTPSDRPTTVYQAIVSLPKAEQLAIAREVMKSPHPVLYVQSESFAADVLDRVRETDSCADLTSPVEVYIDSEGWYSVLVYDSMEVAA
jgi:hypothetical protein